MGLAPRPLAACATALALAALSAAAWGQEPASRRVEGDRIITPEGWFARPKVARPPLPEEIARAFVIPIREPITQKTYEAMRRKALRCREARAQLIVLDMDTWGGEAIPALDMARLLKTDLGEIYTVCYVRTRAVSAGALIAIACHEIVMTPVGTFGDCAPILLGEKLEGVEREKMETVLRSEFAESAERNGYSVPLAESMVSIQREVWLIRDKRMRELRYADADAWRGKVDASGATSGPANPSAEWELLRVVNKADELLTMHTREAVEYGFVNTVIKPAEPEALAGLMDRYHVTAKAVVLEDTWSERMVEFLTSPAVMGFLFFVAILCAYIEINAPGHIVPGIIAVLCFAVIFGSRYLIGMAAWWEIVVFVLGVLLILAEVFVIPGHGIAGIAGLICCIVGLLAILIPNAPGEMPIPRGPSDWSIFADGAFALGTGFVLALLAAAIVARYLPRVPLAGRLVLPDIPTPNEPPVAPQSPLKRIRSGDVGVVEAMCRPVGKVRFGDDLLDATSEGAIIQAGAKVRVLRREGNQLFVEKV